MSNIQVMHFLNGEDVVANVKESMDIIDDFGFITVENPCTITLVPNPANHEQVGIQLRPWCPWAGSTTMKVSRSHMVYMVEPVRELINQYNQIFGAGIVVAGPDQIPPPSSGASIHRIK